MHFHRFAIACRFEKLFLFSLCMGAHKVRGFSRHIFLRFDKIVLLEVNEINQTDYCFGDSAVLYFAAHTLGVF